MTSRLGAGKSVNFFLQFMARVFVNAITWCSEAWHVHFEQYRARIYRPSFRENKPKALVFVKTGSINSGTSQYSTVPVLFILLHTTEKYKMLYEYMETTALFISELGYS